jgi:hypothetical protein
LTFCLSVTGWQATFAVSPAFEAQGIDAQGIKAQGIEVPFPQTVVHLKNPVPDAPPTREE